MCECVCVGESEIERCIVLFCDKAVNEYIHTCLSLFFSLAHSLGGGVEVLTTWRERGSIDCDLSGCLYLNWWV